MQRCDFLESFIFCPKCAGEFLDNDVKSKRCKECGFVYYFNPSSAVVAIIRNIRGEILVAIRAKEPAKGTYDLPGGFLDSFESAEQCVKREVFEECNLEVKSLKYLFSLPNTYNYSNFEVHTLDMFFECVVDDFDNLKAADDVDSLLFIAPDDITASKFGLHSISLGIAEYIKMI